MNPKIRFDQSIYLILYARYKAYLLPLGVIGASLLVFLTVIIPQFENYLSNKDTVAANQRTIQTLSDNINTLGLLKEDEINKNLLVASAALPSEKDYTGILNAISSAASVSNVSLGDYSFQVGDLFGKTSNAGNGQLTLTVTLAISGDINNAQKFINTLAKEFPLSEVNSISLRGLSGSQIDATFFYNPLPPIQFNPGFPVARLSSQQEKLMDSLSKDFQKPADLAIPKKQIATDSATSTP